MSFGSGGAGVKKFESQSEIDEKRKQRQDEWDKVRKPDDPLDCPEEAVDTRSLFEKLQEQKDRKDMEYEEEHKLRNCVKGLNEDEAKFLDFVSQRQTDVNKERRKEEDEVLQEMRNTPVATASGSSTKSEDKKASRSGSAPAQSKRSQLTLLAGAVKRKSTETTDNEKRRKLSQTEETPEAASGPNIEKASPTATPANTVQVAQVIGVLPGLGAYHDSETSDSASSSSDSEIEFSILPAAHINDSNIKKLVTQIQQRHGQGS